MKRKIINTTLIDLFGEKDFINHLYIGRELWLRTEIGIDEEAMERLKNENCLPLPYARK